MRQIVLLAVGVAGLAVAAAGAARADEPLFGYIYTTDLLPAQKWEVEQWSTLREGRSQGRYHLWQGRSEVSYGVTSDFQLSGYVNYAATSVNRNAPDHMTSPPEVFADYAVDPDRPFNKARFQSVSLEGIYRILSPYTDPVGLAVYAEPSIGPRTRELEMRLILQKNFLDDTLVLAFNLTYALEKRYLPGEFGAEPGSPEAAKIWDRETDVNFSLGLSYRFAPRWSAGGEFLNEREWAGFNALKSSMRTNVAWFLGPNVHYADEHFFVTATFLFQLPFARDLENPGPGFIKNGITNADDFEKYRFRVKAGYVF